MPTIHECDPRILHFISASLAPELAVRLRLGDPDLFVCYYTPDTLLVCSLDNRTPWSWQSGTSSIPAQVIAKLPIGAFQTFDTAVAPPTAIRAPRIYRVCLQLEESGP